MRRPRTRSPDLREVAELVRGRLWPRLFVLRTLISKRWMRSLCLQIPSSRQRRLLRSVRPAKLHREEPSGCLLERRICAHHWVCSELRRDLLRRRAVRTHPRAQKPFDLVTMLGPRARAHLATNTRRFHPRSCGRDGCRINARGDVTSISDVTRARLRCKRPA